MRVDYRARIKELVEKQTEQFLTNAPEKDKIKTLIKLQELQRKRAESGCDY